MQRKLEEEAVERPAFKEEDLVLKFKHAKEKESKFQLHWVGPYTVYEVYGNGTYKLQSVEGKILKNSTNGNDL